MNGTQCSNNNNLLENDKFCIISESFEGPEGHELSPREISDNKSLPNWVSMTVETVSVS